MRNNFITKIIGATLAAAMMIGVGAGVNAFREAKPVNADDQLAYTINLTGSQTESTTLSTSNLSNITGSGASTYIESLTTCTKTYGPTTNGVKLGASSNAGTFTFSLKNTGQVTATKFVVNAKLYNSSKSATLNVNSIGSQSVTAAFSNLTFTPTSASNITSITLNSSKYIWVKSVSVYIGGSGGGSSSSSSSSSSTTSETPTYTVTYHDTNKTDGYAPSDNRTYESGDTFEVKGNLGSLARTGYEWFGWSLNQDGSGTAYGPAFESNYTINDGNVDFYPIWAEVPSLPSYNEELAFDFLGLNVSNNTGYEARSATVDSEAESKYESAEWQITVGNNSAQLGTNAKVGNLEKTTLGNGDFPAASGLASALNIQTTTQKYSAAICTTPMSSVHEVELIFSDTNGGAMTSAWVLSSTDGNTWQVESRKVWNIVTGTKFVFERNVEERQYAFVAYWNLTNSGGLKGFELKLYGDYTRETIENTKTQTELSYRYSKDGNEYTYTDITMRFGGLVNKTVWGNLDTNEHLIAGVGVMITGYREQLRTSYSVKDHANEAVSSTGEFNIKTQLVDYYVTLNTFEVAENENNYYWNLRYSIASQDDIMDEYTAAAYIKLTSGELVFFKQVEYSVWSLAYDYLTNRNCDEYTAGGSLYHLFNDAGME